MGHPAPVMSDRYVVTLATGQTVTGIDFANARACDCYTVSSYQFLINGTTMILNDPAFWSGLAEAMRAR